MTVTIVGNRGTSSQGGSVRSPNGANSLTVFANTANDVALIDTSGILPARMAVGLYLQGSVAATVLFTMDDPKRATNPDPTVQAGVTWGSSTSLTAGAITNAPVLPTAIKITFSAAGQVNIAAR